MLHYLSLSDSCFSLIEAEGPHLCGAHGSQVPRQDVPALAQPREDLQGALGAALLRRRGAVRPERGLSGKGTGEGTAVLAEVIATVVAVSDVHSLTRSVGHADCRKSRVGILDCLCATLKCFYQ